ncbi:putative inner membrane protein [Planctomycetes bacterium CA13]|uniref:Putative inner membrane protein n=1 Tax=Novipirellula herctigrandis TaxID=2527986 RepID=A0A5C5ZDA0_9BACT|nr:putative inner membrane protein [Planctomycetes bacterium CA13]
MSSNETNRDIGHSPSTTNYWNPYLCGVLIGLVLIASYTVLGTGVGASAGPARLGAQIERWIAPTHTAATEYFAGWGEHPLAYYLVFMLVGTFVGGLVSALLAGRVECGVVERGKAFGAVPRLMFAGGGGLIVGFASRLARGCTSGQALSGGALLLTGSLIFVACLFAGGYASAFLFRRQWND